MRTRDLMVVMGSLGGTIVLLYGWPTLHRYENTVDNRLVRISRVTQETRILEEGRGWVKAGLSSPPRSLYCEGTCPDKPSNNKSWRPTASLEQPRSWTLSKSQQKNRPKAPSPEKHASSVRLQSSASELNLGGSAQCACQQPGSLWRFIQKILR